MSFKDYFKFWGNEIIEFYCHPDLLGVIPEPKPASKNLPTWFKTLEPHYTNTSVIPLENEERDEFGEFKMTAKKCLPLVDSMTLGYTIPLCGDVRIVSNHDNTKMRIFNPPEFSVCEGHEVKQLGGVHALGIKHGDALKFINHWIIKTAPGWSTLFVSPLNQFDQPFTCLSGLVDTDIYRREINFPGLLRVYNADITIKAGTPLVTAIPIKRNSFPTKPKVRKITKEEAFEYAKSKRIQKSRSHYYTYELRKRD